MLICLDLPMEYAYINAFLCEAIYVNAFNSWNRIQSRLLSSSNKAISIINAVKCCFVSNSIAEIHHWLIVKHKIRKIITRGFLVIYFIILGYLLGNPVCRQIKKLKIITCSKLIECHATDWCLVKTAVMINRYVSFFSARRWIGKDRMTVLIYTFH